MLLGQPLLTITKGSKLVIVTVDMLAQALKAMHMLSALKLDYTLYSLHSHRRGSAMAAYCKGVDQLHIKRHGL